MNAALSPHASCAAGLFSFCLLDGLPVRFRRSYVQQAPAGCGHKRLATALMTIRVHRMVRKRSPTPQILAHGSARTGWFFVCMILVYSVDQSNPMTIANQIHQINPPASLVRRKSPSPAPHKNSASALAAEASWADAATTART
jgi:hypothetical protein